MTLDFSALAVPSVRSLKPYVPGKPVETLLREYRLDRVVKLASNENPLGPSPKALLAAEAALGEVSRYPDGENYRLKQRLGAELGVEPACLTLGNGSNDVLDIIARTFSGPGCEVVVSEFAFAIYGLVSQSVGASVRVVPAKAWGHDLDSMAAAVTQRTRLIYLANPNNPTGTCFSDQALRNFLTKVPRQVLVVLDEAYFEYLDPKWELDGIKYLSAFPNLIICRTFSKAYGLAGLRVGYALSRPEAAELMNRVRQPFNVNMVAQAAALAALDDVNHLHTGVALNHSGMQQLEVGLTALGLGWIPSSANFLAVNCGSGAMQIHEALQALGVIVRPLAGYGMPEFLRVSVGLEEENAYFLKVMAQILGKEPA